VGGTAEDTELVDKNDDVGEIVVESEDELKDGMSVESFHA